MFFSLRRVISRSADPRNAEVLMITLLLATSVITATIVFGPVLVAQLSRT